MSFSLLVACWIVAIGQVAEADDHLVPGTIAQAPTRQAAPSTIHMANGIKIGDADSDSALVWVRLTLAPHANSQGTAFEARKANEPQLPEGKQLSDMEGAVVGTNGEVRVRYQITGSKEEPLVTDWSRVTAETDFTHTFALSNLRPASNYEIVVEGRSAKNRNVSCTVDGRFRTAPQQNAQVAASFCVIACQDYPRRDDKQRGHLIYEQMLTLSPDFMAHTGDTLYYDKPKPYAKTAAFARFKWNRFYGLELPREFHRQVATWFIKDDHDTLKDDCWPGQRYGELTFARGLEIYREQLPVPEVPYRHLRWGKHLEVWFLEGREFRSPNRQPDGPSKTILGEPQMNWLRDTLTKSNATFRIVVSATPIVGPDRKSKRDNHANANFQFEGDKLRKLLASQPNTYVICGDRHWQYASKDPVTGLREWCCGSASDQHSGGFRMSDRTEMHDYLKICGGFLHVRVQEQAGAAQLQIRHYDPRGGITHQDTITAR